MMNLYSLSKLKQQSILLLAAFTMAMPVMANPVIPIQAQPQQPSFTPSAPNLSANSYILIDATSGRVLAEKDANKRLPPASLTKLMSMYVVSAAVKSGHASWDDKVHISTKAWKTEGSRMFVKVGSEVPLKDLAQGSAVVSGNDATVALAEHIAGTEEAFADLMNQQAKKLGMKDTHFTDSTGLPNPDHYSTAHDLAILSQAYIKDFPEDYHFYAEKWMTYNGIKQPNRNRLLWRYQYADGLKTGHTKEAGFCLVGSAKKDGMRLITVVMGEPSDRMRTEDSARLLTYGFRFYQTHKLYNATTPLVKARVWKGQKTEVSLGIKDDFYVTVPTGQYKRLKANLKLNNPIKAPVQKGDVYGSIIITLNNDEIATMPLVALENDPQGGAWRRAADTVKYNIHKLFSKSDPTPTEG